MLRVPLLVVLVAALIVISGCLGVFGTGATPTTTEQPSSTRTTVSTASATPPESITATPSPGMARAPSATSVEWFDAGAPERMIETHETTLRNTSFTMRFRHVRFTNGTLAFRINGTVRHDGNGTFRFNYTSFGVGPGKESTRTVDVWTNGTTARRIVTTENGSSIEDARPSTMPPSFADSMAAYLRAFRTEVTGYSRLGGELTVRISGSDIRSTGSRAERIERYRQFRIRKVHGGEFSAEFVDTHVSQYRIRFSGREASTSITVNEDVTFEAVGSTTVERPAWIDASNTSRPG